MGLENAPKPEVQNKKRIHPAHIAKTLAKLPKPKEEEDEEEEEEEREEEGGEGEEDEEIQP